MHSKTQTLFIVYLHFCRVFVLCVNTWYSLAVWWRISWFVVRHFRCSCNVYLGQGRSWDRRIQPKSWTPGNILLHDAWYFKILFLFIINRKKINKWWFLLLSVAVEKLGFIFNHLCYFPMVTIFYAFSRLISTSLQICFFLNSSCPRRKHNKYSTIQT